MRASTLNRRAVLAAAVLAAVAALAVACDETGASPPAADATSDARVEAGTPTEVPDASPAPSPHVELPKVLAAGLAEPRGVVLIGADLYVAEHGGGRIVAVPRSGGALRVVASGLSGPLRLATDGTTSLVATEREGGKVIWIDLGGKVTLLASGMAQPGEVRTSRGEAFWLESGAEAGAGALWRASLDGGAPRKASVGITRAHGLAIGASAAYVTADAVEETKGNVFAAAIDDDRADASDGGSSRLSDTPEQALGIAADEQSGVVYWAARKNTSVGGSEGFLRKTALDGGKTDALTEIPYGADRVVAHGQYVYFTENYQTLARVRASGGPREDLALHTSVGDLVVTDDAVYWTDADAGKLYALDLAGAP